MTQCNAGALATGGIGTALGVIRVAVDTGHKIEVLVPETRPYLQGARLTAWELHQDDIPLTLITDNMVGHFLKTGKVGAVVVGADRIAATATRRIKSAPTELRFWRASTTFRFTWRRRFRRSIFRLPQASKFPSRSARGRSDAHLGGVRISPDVRAAHPAFDVTPARFIAAIITERGVARAPFEESLAALAGARARCEGVGREGGGGCAVCRRRRSVLGLDELAGKGMGGSTPETVLHHLSTARGSALERKRTS